MRTIRYLTLLLSGALAGALTGGCAEGPLDTGAESSAITHGELDGDAHPFVVLILMEVNGRPAFRCSGTLISPTTVLTAGHCTGAPGELSGIRVFTESVVQNGANNYPFAGPNAVEAVAWSTHPQYASATFFLHDVGVIKLAAPIHLASYGDAAASQPA